MNGYVANLIRRSTGRAVMLCPDIPPLFGAPEAFEQHVQSAPLFEQQNPGPDSPIPTDTPRRINDAKAIESPSPQYNSVPAGNHEPAAPRALREAAMPEAERPQTVFSPITEAAKPRPVVSREQAIPQRDDPAATRGSDRQDTDPEIIRTPAFPPPVEQLRVHGSIGPPPMGVDNPVNKPSTFSATPTSPSSGNVPTAAPSPLMDRIIETHSQLPAPVGLASHDHNTAAEYRTSLPPVPSLLRAIAGGPSKRPDETAEQSIQISIGRIEVRPPAATTGTRQEPKPVKGRSLEAYLRARSQRSGQ